jgi:hypothetical protein
MSYKVKVATHGTAGVSPASSYTFAQITVESVNFAKVTLQEAGETPAVPAFASSADRNK